MSRQCEFFSTLLVPDSTAPFFPWCASGTRVSTNGGAVRNQVLQVRIFGEMVEHMVPDTLSHQRA